MANLDAFYGGFQAGNDMAETQRAQRNRALVGNLAGAAIGGDPQAMAKVAAVDPRAAASLQQTGDGMLRRSRGAAQYVQKALQSGNPAQIAAARRAAKPYLDTLSPGTAYSLDMDPAQELAGIEAFLSQTQYLDPSYSGASGVQSTYVDDGGNRVAIMRNGSTQVLGRNDAGANQQTLSIDVNGVPTQVTFDRRTGRYTNAAIGGGQPATEQSPQRADMEADIALANQMIAAGIPDTQVDAFLAQRGARTQQPGTPLVGRRKEDEARAVAQAQSDVELANLPTRLDMQTQADIERARGVEQAKTQAERDAQAPKRIKQYEQAIGAAGSVMNSLDNAIKLIGPTTTGWGGARLRSVEGTDAYNLAAEIETIKANLGFDRLQQMRDSSPTGGALGAIAVQELVALQSTIANLDPNQSAEQIKQNLERVKKHYEGWASAVQQALVNERNGSQATPQAAAPRTIVRTGTSNGRKVVQYSDGSVEYGN